MAIKSADQITIVDVTDAYSVILSSEAYTFVGGTSGATSGSCTTEVSALCGSNLCSSVIVSNSDITCPAGISASIQGSGTEKVTITFTITATISAACEATIKVHVDGIEVNKKFSFAVAKTGAPGAKGDTGATGKGISKIETFYLTTASGSGVTTSTSGWSTTPEPTTTTKKYIWSYTKTTYTSGDPTSSTPAIIGTHGATGDKGAAGADAITLTITTSNGTVFKNNTGSTVLTAHVYKGGIEQSITDAGVCGSLGTIKWYNGSGTQPSGWPKTSKTITAGASSGSGIDVVVSNATAITCQLEK